MHHKTQEKDRSLRGRIKSRRRPWWLFQIIRNLWRTISLTPESLQLSWCFSQTGGGGGLSWPGAAQGPSVPLPCLFHVQDTSCLALQSDWWNSCQGHRTRLLFKAPDLSGRCDTSCVQPLSLMDCLSLFPPYLGMGRTGGWGGVDWILAQVGLLKATNTSCKAT